MNVVRQRCLGASPTSVGDCVAGRGFTQLVKMQTEKPPNKKRVFGDARTISKQKRQKLEAPSQLTGSHEEVLKSDIDHIFKQQSAHTGTLDEDESLPTPFTEVEVNITSLSSVGDGLGHTAASLRIYLVPFTVPGDKVLAKVVRHTDNPPHTITDFVRVLTPGPSRDDDLVRCKYFARCGGCQLQMLPYEAQLAHKRTIVQKAYRNFSGLPASCVPNVAETAGSPHQYGYRTKLTPHFDGPQGARRANRRGEKARFETAPPIGFLQKGTRRTLDVEECPIGTEVVQRGLVRERQRVRDQLSTFRKGATILLRESTRRYAKGEHDIPIDSLQEIDKNMSEPIVCVERGGMVDKKTCISDNRGVSTEYVDDFVFQNSANAFFQNNNSILPSFTSYIRENIIPHSTDHSQAPLITNLIDAYSGSGLFAITLSSLFKRTIGIDISGESIESASTNLRLNRLDGGDRDIRFLAADASKLFATVPDDFHAANTAVVIDPPRKGCDEAFLKQLLAFGPARIVYVSCNVHTQARDVGWILRGGGVTSVPANDDTDRKQSDTGVSGNGDSTVVANAVAPLLTEPKSYAYAIESLRGFDFFPQTGHVEGVAVLQRKVVLAGSNDGRKARPSPEDQATAVGEVR